MNDVEPQPVPGAQSDFELTGVSRELRELERGARELELEMSQAIAAVPESQRASARNLVQYIALRQRDLRTLQAELAESGLSSLGRSESCVLGAVLEVASRAQESLAQRQQDEPGELVRLAKARSEALSWEAADELLQRHSAAMFGTRPIDRHIYIMVTAPSAREADAEWMVKLLESGMNVLRINCAHESEVEWAQVIDALARARAQTGRACRLIMDLAGPKIRTGRIELKKRIATWKPARDALGRPTSPARVRIRRATAEVHEDMPATLSIDDQAFAKLRVDDELRFRDTRRKQRSLVIEELSAEHLVASSLERAYVLDEVEAQIRRGKKHKDDVTLHVAEGADEAIEVQTGDTLWLSRQEIGGWPAERDEKGRLEKPGMIGCTLPAALEHLEIGQRVLFDDGKIQTVVERLKKTGDFSLKVLRTHKPVSKLRAEKGINLPDTRVSVAGFTDDDRRALPFVVKHADAVSLSFVRSVEDLTALHQELDRLGQAEIGVILKIETRAGFENLPALLLEGLRRPPLSVMIARGDLAVEVGFERLAELQEEMLWLCEAAHVPAIWATQVLDTLARTGVPSRAEVTDASASVAAECVMLNKGPYVHEAVLVLASILQRMEKHRYKKRSLFRKLEVSSFDPK